MSRWIDELLRTHAKTAKSVADLGFERLATCYPPSLLSAARIAIVAEIPAPPVMEFDLPEFLPMTTMPFSGITFRDMFFTVAADTTEGLCCHELVHVVQWGTLGVEDFLITYGAGILQRGYAESPLEAIAFATQERFEAGLALPGLVDAVAAHAIQQRSAVAALYGQYGVRMRG